MEEEVREILSAALNEEDDRENWVRGIRARIAPLGGIDLALPPRGEGPKREPPVFD